MGLYLRKAFSFGPLRLNLSRSGLGASFGVRGARLGIGPRGTYVHAGRGGLYYKRSLRTRVPTDTERVPVAPTHSSTGSMQEIESAEASQMVDGSSAQLLEELNRVKKRRSIAPFVAICCFALLWIAVAKLTLLISGLLAFPLFAAILWARHLDVTHGTSVLRYELDSNAEASFTRLTRGFDQLCSCSAVWHVEASGDALDRKRSAGATQLIRRRTIHPLLSLPPRMECNLTVPTLPAGAQTLYFFPDRVLVYERSGVGAVAYGHLSTEAGQTRFIEEDIVPEDTEVLDRTWKYVNKSGGPDRRFSGNRELPVVGYGFVHLTSRSGLNEMFNCSNVAKATAFISTIPKPALAPPS
jgi:uncharacterized protein DUF4236